MESLKALVVTRLSNLTDATTSPERQLDVCKRLCADRGWEVVDVAQDLDVSASATSPFERPELKKRLAQPERFDVIVFWRVDRLVRRVTHLAQMIDWAEEHGITLVSATEQAFDLSTPIGKAIAYMVSIFAEMEAAAISERTEQAYAHNRRLGKYTGGPPPYGYLPEKNGDGEWRYVPDLDNKPFILGLIDQLLAGGRPHTIVRDLNRRGVPSPEDYFREKQGKPLKGSKWTSANLTRALTSPALLGQMTFRPVIGKKNGRKVYGNPELVRGDDGKPVVRAEPLIDRELHDRLRKYLDGIKGKRSPYTTSESLLTGVLWCGVCELEMYRNKGRNHYLYRCRSANIETSCGNPGWRQDAAEELVSKNLLDEFGDTPRMKRIFVPAEDTAAELAEVNAELIDVAGLIGTGPFKSGPARERLEERAAALDARRSELEATPSREAGYRYEPTGETFKEYWEGLDKKQRNLFLRDNGVRLEWDGRVPEFHLYWNELEKLKEAVRS
ncbi:recombinase family protein [Saccharopolyspora pogona]|uniref:recombinase family protein n=1 Tax=Saccharopolyspora pogona TaxID=333966 RepID=UPI001689CE6D|nr:recombinase family protein [Saccharopolyspora pogona]